MKFCPCTKTVEADGRRWRLIKGREFDTITQALEFTTVTGWCPIVALSGTRTVAAVYMLRDVDPNALIDDLQVTSDVEGLT